MDAREFLAQHKLMGGYSWCVLNNSLLSDWEYVVCAGHRLQCETAHTKCSQLEK